MTSGLVYGGENGYAERRMQALWDEVQRDQAKGKGWASGLCQPHGADAAPLRRAAAGSTAPLPTSWAR